MESPAVSVSGGGILLTEDHPPTAELLRGLLASAFPDHLIRAVTSAEEALDLCRAVPPQLAIMDISLPGMNGIEATRQIKDFAPSVHVIMHTNLDGAIFADECMKAGASAYVAKGQPRADLVPVVRLLLSIPPNTAPAAL